MATSLNGNTIVQRKLIIILKLRFVNLIIVALKKRSIVQRLEELQMKMITHARDTTTAWSWRTDRLLNTTTRAPVHHCSTLIPNCALQNINAFEVYAHLFLERNGCLQSPR